MKLPPGFLRIGAIPSTWARGLAGRHLLCKEGIVGSNPTGSTLKKPALKSTANIKHAGVAQW